jgi:hypothetical protein
VHVWVRVQIHMNNNYWCIIFAQKRVIMFQIIDICVWVRVRVRMLERLRALQPFCLRVHVWVPVGA